MNLCWTFCFVFIFKASALFKHRCIRSVHNQTCWLMTLYSVKSLASVSSVIHLCKVSHHTHSFCNLLFTQTMYFINIQTQSWVMACSCTFSICLVFQSYTQRHAHVHLDNYSVKHFFISSDLLAPVDCLEAFVLKSIVCMKTMLHMWYVFSWSTQWFLRTRHGRLFGG